MTDAASTLLTIAGAAVGWFGSRRYYRLSGADLQTSTRIIETTLSAIGHLIEHDNGTVTLTRNADGMITGVTKSATLTAAGSSSAQFVGGSTRVQPPQYDRQEEQPKSVETDRPDA